MHARLHDAGAPARFSWRGTCQAAAHPVSFGGAAAPEAPRTVRRALSACCVTDEEGVGQRERGDWRGGSERPRIHCRSRPRTASRALSSRCRVTRRFAGRCSLRPGVAVSAARVERSARKLAAGSSSSAACMGAKCPTAPRTSKRGCWRPSTTSSRDGLDSAGGGRRAPGPDGTRAARAPRPALSVPAQAAHPDSSRPSCMAERLPPPSTSSPVFATLRAGDPDRARDVADLVRVLSARQPGAGLGGRGSRPRRGPTHARGGSRPARARVRSVAAAGSPARRGTVPRAAPPPGVAGRRVVAAEARPRRDRPPARAPGSRRVPHGRPSPSVRGGDGDAGTATPGGVSFPRIWVTRGPTGGLAYARLAVDLSGVEPDRLDDLAALCEVLPESGHGGFTPSQTRARIARVCDRLSIEPMLLARAAPDSDATGASVPGSGSAGPAAFGSNAAGPAAPGAVLLLSARARACDEAELLEVLADSYLDARFDGTVRAAAANARTRRLAQISRNGHLHAERVAASGLDSWSALSERWLGPSALGVLAGAAGRTATASRRSDDCTASTAHSPPRRAGSRSCATGRPDRTPIRLRSAGHMRRGRRPRPPILRRTPRSGWWIRGRNDPGIPLAAAPRLPSRRPAPGFWTAPSASAPGCFPRRPPTIRMQVRFRFSPHSSGRSPPAKRSRVWRRLWRGRALLRSDGDGAPVLIPRSAPVRNASGLRRGNRVPAAPAAGGARARGGNPAGGSRNRSPAAFQIAARERFLDELQGRGAQGSRPLRASVLGTSPDRLRDVADRYLRPDAGLTGVLARTGSEGELDRLGIAWRRL